MSDENTAFDVLKARGDYWKARALAAETNTKERPEIEPCFHFGDAAGYCQYHDRYVE